MTELEIRRELAAIDEKIALAKLEVSKAEERVRELEYQKANFQLNVMVAMCKAQQAPPQAPQQQEKK